MKKNNINKAATRFFATQGYDGTTTKAISDKAGVTEPLLYYHFTGKDEIYTSILDSVFSDYFKQLKCHAIGIREQGIEKRNQNPIRKG